MPAGLLTSILSLSLGLVTQQLPHSPNSDPVVSLWWDPAALAEREGSEIASLAEQPELYPNAPFDRSLAAAPLPLRSETWDADISMGLKINQWAMFGARTNIVSNGTRWKLNVDDTLGGGLFVSARVNPYSIELFFDDDYAVLTTADRLTIQSWGAHLGVDFFANEWQRFTLLTGPLLIYPHLDFKEAGLSIPGKLERSAGGEIGVRYSKTVTEGRIESPKVGFLAEGLFRYAPFRFTSNGTVANEKFGGAGILISLGIWVRF